MVTLMVHDDHSTNVLVPPTAIIIVVKVKGQKGTHRGKSSVGRKICPIIVSESGIAHDALVHKLQVGGYTGHGFVVGVGIGMTVRLVLEPHRGGRGKEVVQVKGGKLVVPVLVSHL